MGTVFLAVDTETDRRVALKLLSKENSANPKLAARFQAEAASAQQLNHENIVSVYESGEADGQLYIAQEYIEGTDVQKLLKKRGKLPVARTLEIVKQVTRALDHAFRQGIVHRDIKPSNMLIKRNGTVKLADMGLARSVDEAVDTGLTRVGTTVGTVDYMAPEQARDSKSADVRSDIYSLGCAWYHMLTGKPPFPKGSLTNKLYAHISNPRPDPRDANPDVPEEFSRIIRKMMSRSPKDRYQTPGELLEVLERLSFRGDAVSRKFLSALEEVVESEAVTPDEKPAAPQVTSRRRIRRSRGAANLPLGEYAWNTGVILVALTVATLLWWLLTMLLPM